MADSMTSDPLFSPSYRLSSVKFLTFTAEEIMKMSCKRITNPETFDSLLHPNPGGLHDPALGPCDKEELCGTCGLNYIHCPGHIGHIILPLNVLHPIFFQSLYKVLRGLCFVCNRLASTQYRIELLKGQIALLDKGFVSAALDLGKHVNEQNKKEADSTVVEQTHSYVQSFLEQEPDHSSPKIVSKHLTELREQFIDSFFKNLSTKCPHCEAPIRKIRHEYQTKIMVRPLSGKLSAAWEAAVKQRRVNNESTTETELTNQNHLIEKCKEQHLLNPFEVRNHFRSLWVNDPHLMTCLFSCLKDFITSSDPSQGGKESATCPVDMFFIDVIGVPPTRFRPISTVAAKRFENSQTTNLQRILKWSEEITAILKERSLNDEELAKLPAQKKSITERLQYAWIMLQTDVNGYMDSDINKRVKDIPSGIKQIMEKKEGLFRKHMMGKRVNYAARSVISPDPNINMDEIGIPMVFACKLTYPEPVTHWNVHELRQAVINGPNVHPGATHVQNEDGSLILLSPHNPLQRQGIAKRLLAPDRLQTSGGVAKKVYRHVRNGDAALLNRQPTLHKPSIMAMKARVLPGEKTLRLHYANCKAYNADFDGDEMNLHLPQNELARSEAYNLVSTHHQYLVPKDGTPLSGLIQDHVVSGLLMTIRGQLFTCSDYQQLLFAALPNFLGYFKLLPPCVFKPQRLWSGKQVVSTLLVNLIPEGQKQLNLISKTKINSKSWAGNSDKKPFTSSRYQDNIMTESEVIFREGNLLCGVLDKSQIGASQYGFVHACYELYGGSVANELLSALGRVFTFFLQLHGFSLGIEDILVTAKADKRRHKIIRKGRKKQCGAEAAAEAFGVTDIQDTDSINEKYRSIHHAYTGNGLKILDYYVKKKTDQINNSINTACVPNGLLKPFPFNALQLMVQAGAKGSTVNCMQISSLLGQIELEGQRPPIMISGKSLPSFTLYDTSPRAGGFIDGRFLTGIRPQEFFFHCMAGREGLIDTAVKTSRSGYLQRCLIKHLEGITGHYDLTVRDSDGSIIQFLSGEDGLDVCKTRYLTADQMPFLKDNYQAFLYRLDPKSSLEVLDSVKADKYQRKVDKWTKKQKKLFKPVSANQKRRRSGFLDFYEQHLPEVKEELVKDKPRPESNYRTKSQLQVIEKWYKASPMFRERENSKYKTYYDPVMFSLRADRYFGSIPEKINTQINQYLAQYDDTDNESLSKEKLKALVQFKCLRALSDPGEGLGLLAAQSIGEPSTQMTLNTFHFAGRGEMNVTLGIPRLREILMTASPNIKTPAMEVPLLPSPTVEHDGEKLKKIFTCVHVKDVLDKVEVTERMNREGKGFRHRLFCIKLTFLEHHYYENDYLLKPSDVIEYMESTFIFKLVSAIMKEMKMVKNKRMNSIGVIADKDTQSGNSSSKDDDSNDADPARPPPTDNGGDNDDTDVSDIDMDEPDAGNERMRRKKQQHVSYESDDDPDNDKEEHQNDDNYDDDVSIVMDDQEGIVVETETKKVRKSSSDTHNDAKDDNRVQAVKALSSNIVEYSYDAKQHLWCEVTLKFPSVDYKIMVSKVIEKMADKMTIREIPNIKRGFLSKIQSEGVWQLKTEGVNMQELWKYQDILDLKRAYTNNIHSVANTFGIEAANRAIIKEISTVFGMYGIQVDYRHLSLIADYMTFDGSYKAFNRYGLESNTSPFQKMSFETTMKFLKNATVNGDEDDLKSPSACLVTGRVANGGTGCVSLRHNLLTV